MRAARVTLRLVVSGLLLLVVVAAISGASFRAGFNARCGTGNVGGAVTLEKNKTLQGEGAIWMRHALACRAGDYLIMVPNEAGHGQSVMIGRKGRPLLFVNDKETDLFDESGERVIFGSVR